MSIRLPWGQFIATEVQFLRHSHLSTYILWLPACQRGCCSGQHSGVSESWGRPFTLSSEHIPEGAPQELLWCLPEEEHFVQTQALKLVFASILQLSLPLQFHLQLHISFWSFTIVNPKPTTPLKQRPWFFLGMRINSPVWILFEKQSKGQGWQEHGLISTFWSSLCLLGYKRRWDQVNETDTLAAYFGIQKNDMKDILGTYKNYFKLLEAPLVQTSVNWKPIMTQTLCWQDGKDSFLFKEFYRLVRQIMFTKNTRENAPEETQDSWVPG